MTDSGNVVGADASSNDSEWINRYIHVLRFGKPDARQHAIEALSCLEALPDELVEVLRERAQGDVNRDVKLAARETLEAHDYRVEPR